MARARKRLKKEAELAEIAARGPRAVTAFAAARSEAADVESLLASLKAGPRAAAGARDEAARPPVAPASQSRAGLTEEAKRYLLNWLEENKSHPYPSRKQKDEMVELLKLEDDRKLEGWFCRARKKIQQKHDDEAGGEALSSANPQLQGRAQHQLQQAQQPLQPHRVQQAQQPLQSHQLQQAQQPLQPHRAQQSPQVHQRPQQPVQPQLGPAQPGVWYAQNG